jgi:hypothetical protein
MTHYDWVLPTMAFGGTVISALGAGVVGWLNIRRLLVENTAKTRAAEEEIRRVAAATSEIKVSVDGVLKRLLEAMEAKAFAEKSEAVTLARVEERATIAQEAKP